MKQPTRDARMVESIADHVLTYMCLADFKNSPGERVDARTFSGALPMLDEWTKRHDDVPVFLDAKPSDLAKPLNVSIVTPTSDGTAKFTLIRNRAVTAKDVRGQILTPRRHLVKAQAAWILESGRADALTTLLGSNDGVKWTQVSNIIRTEIPDEWYSESVAVSYGMAFAEESFWAVTLGWIGQPSVKFWTDPVGAREVFRLRDLPDGRQRRAALKHWVSEHWRQNRTDHTEQKFVREHLRGAERFVWNDFVCELAPSLDDQRREHEAKNEREEMREAGADRRTLVTA